MKNLLFVSLMTLASASAFAGGMGVYECKLDDGSKTASFVYSFDDQGGQFITWMPSSGLKTVRANAQGHLINSGEVQFTLFGFQDQSDFLFLAPGASSLPQTLNVETYHDNDDEAEDVQKFTCTKNL